MQTRARSRSQGAPDEQPQAAAEPAQPQAANAQPAGQPAAQPQQVALSAEQLMQALHMLLLQQQAAAGPQSLVNISDRGTQENNVDRRLSAISAFDLDRPWTLREWELELQRLTANISALLQPDDITRTYKLLTEAEVFVKLTNKLKTQLKAIHRTKFDEWVQDEQAHHQKLNAVQEYFHNYITDSCRGQIYMAVRDMRQQPGEQNADFVRRIADIADLMDEPFRRMLFLHVNHAHAFRNTAVGEKLGRLTRDQKEAKADSVLKLIDIMDDCDTNSPHRTVASVKRNGHNKPEKATKEIEKVKCRRCEKDGHTAEKCYGKARNISRLAQLYESVTKDLKIDIATQGRYGKGGVTNKCSRCDLVGHWESNCLLDRPPQAYRGKRKVNLILMGITRNSPTKAMVNGFTEVPRAKSRMVNGFETRAGKRKDSPTTAAVTQEANPGIRLKDDKVIAQRDATIAQLKPEPAAAQSPAATPPETTVNAARAPSLSTTTPVNLEKVSIKAVDLCINGSSIRAWVDSGSEADIMHIDTISKRKFPGMVKQAGKLHNANGEQGINLIGYLTVDVKINEKVSIPIRFEVSDNIACPCLIGLPALTAMNFVHDFNANTLTHTPTSTVLTLHPADKREAIGGFYMNSLIACALEADEYQVFAPSEGWKGLPGPNKLEPFDPLMTDYNPVKAPYPINPPKKIQEICREVADNMISNGLAEVDYESKSDIVPVVVTKPDAGTRFTLNMKVVNEKEVGDHYKMPRLDDQLNRYGELTFTHVLDQWKCFDRIRCSERYSQLLIVRVPGQPPLRWKAAPQGAQSVPQHLQRQMDKIAVEMKEEVAKALSQVPYARSPDIDNYMDDADIVEHLPTDKDLAARFLAGEEEAIHKVCYVGYRTLLAVFAVARRYNILFSLKKAHFFVRRIVRYGYHITPEGISPAEDATAAIDLIPPPKSLKDVQSFMGSINVYQHLIPDYHEVAGPMLKMMSKDHGEMSYDHPDFLKSHALLKQAIKNLVKPPDWNRPWFVIYDSGQGTTGMVLAQEYDGILFPVRYGSYRQTKTERALSAPMRELVGQARAAQAFRWYIRGHPKVFIGDQLGNTKILDTDLSASTNIKNKYLAILITECPEGWTWMRRGDSLIPIADAISQAKFDEKETSLLPEYAQLQTTAFLMTGEEETDDSLRPLHEFRAYSPPNWRLEQLKDPVLARVIHFFEENDNTPPTQPGWAQRCYLSKDGVLMGSQRTKWTDMLDAKLEQIIVPDHLQTSIIRWSHSNYPYVHSSVKVTQEWITRRYWFYGIKEKVREYIREKCFCLKMRDANKTPPALVIPRQHLTEKFNDLLHADFMDVNTTAPNQEGYNHLLVLVDNKTGWVEAQPVKRKNQTEVVRGIDNAWVSRWGVPMALMTDEGDGFMSTAAKEFYARYDMHKITSASNNPQSNGKAESLVGHIKWLLKTAIQQLENQQEWPELIPMILMAIRTTMKFNTGRPSPDLATLGWKLTLPLDLVAGSSNVPTPSLLVSNRRKVFEWTRQATMKFMEAYEQQPIPVERKFFAPGEMVYLRKRPNFKWKVGELPFDGPFIVKKKIGPTTYTLERTDGTPNKMGPIPLRRLIPHFDIPKWKDIDEMVKQQIEHGVLIIMNTESSLESSELSPKVDFRNAPASERTDANSGLLTLTALTTSRSPHVSHPTPAVLVQGEAVGLGCPFVPARRKQSEISRKTRPANDELAGELAAE